MGKLHKHYPPLETRRKIAVRLLSRALVNLLVAVALGTLFFAFFASVLDNPAEYAIRQSMQSLKYEYGELKERMEELENVMGNVAERDRNVFSLLFESEPYALGDGAERSRWRTIEELSRLTNAGLAELYAERQSEYEKLIAATDSLISDTYTRILEMGGMTNGIPSIQPILNDELTLLTASFGMRIQPYYKVLTMHTGVDYTVPEGTRVFATADGTVASVQSRPSSTGNAITIDHGNGYETRFHHLSKMLVKRGQKVRRGDIIALTGNTGLSLVPHLHYEVRYDDEPVDPIHYFFAELGPSDYQRIIRIARSGMQSFD